MVDRIREWRVGEREYDVRLAFESVRPPVRRCELYISYQSFVPCVVNRKEREKRHTFLTPLKVETDTTAVPLGGISRTSSGSRADSDTICLSGSKPRKVCSGPLDEGG